MPSSASTRSGFYGVNRSAHSRQDAKHNSLFKWPYKPNIGLFSPPPPPPLLFAVLVPENELNKERAGPSLAKERDREKRGRENTIKLISNAQPLAPPSPLATPLSGRPSGPVTQASRAISLAAVEARHVLKSPSGTAIGGVGRQTRRCPERLFPRSGQTGWGTQDGGARRSEEDHLTGHADGWRSSNHPVLVRLRRDFRHFSTTRSTGSGGTDATLFVHRTLATLKCVFVCLKSGVVRS